MKLIFALLLALSLACAAVGPSNVMPVEGRWQIVGQISYGALVCHDTIDFTLAQQDTVITSGDGIWRFSCSDSAQAIGPVLEAIGRVRGDSVVLIWRTQPDLANCPQCMAFHMEGYKDLHGLSGHYFDFLGGTGIWIAVRK